MSPETRPGSKHNRPDEVTILRVRDRWKVFVRSSNAAHVIEVDSEDEAMRISRREQERIGLPQK